MNNINTDDPLQSLLSSDAVSVDRNKLATFLKKFVIIDKDTRQIFLLPDFEKVPDNVMKLEVLLLAAKAKALLFDENDGFTPNELIKLEVMPVGSVKSSLKKLADSRRVKKNTDGRYVIPTYRINEVILKNS